MIDWVSVLIGVLCGALTGVLVGIPTAFLLARKLERDGWTWR